MANGQMKREKASGEVNSYGDYVQAMNYYINTLMGKEPTQRQKNAVDRLNSSDVKKAKSDAREAVRVSETKSTSSSTVPTPEPRSRRAPELTNYGRVGAAPRPRSEQEGKELAGRAAERRYGSGPDRPSTPDTRSKKPIAKRLMEALGDNRSMEQATRDRKMTNRMELEREMMIAGRKKGGMVKKNKSTVKKKQGGSANKVNMKAGFTRRGCAKG